MLNSSTEIFKSNNPSLKWEIVMNSITLNQAVIQEIEKRIETLQAYREKLPWQAVLQKMKISAAIKGYQNHLNSYKIDEKVTGKINTSFNPAEHTTIVDILASPVAFDS